MDMTELLLPAEVALLLRSTTNTLRQWRYKGSGPTFLKAGGRILYAKADIEAWLQRSTPLKTISSETDLDGSG